MLKNKFSEPDYFIIAANLLPVAGVFLWNWSAKEVFLVYCLETVLLGLFTFVKMGIISVVRKSDTWYNQGSRSKQPGLFFMFFFLLHYGIFVGVQMAIFFGVSGIGEGTSLTAFNFFYKWPQLVSRDSLIMLGAFVFCYGFKMLFDFILSGQYRTIPLMQVMFQPYGRIFIQQITVIVGSMFLSFGAGKIFILVFALVKIFFEVYIDYDAILRKGIRDMEADSKKRGDKNDPGQA